MTTSDARFIPISNKTQKVVKTVKPNIRDLILQLLGEEGPLHIYALYRRLLDNGSHVKYETVRWISPVLEARGFDSLLIRGEAEVLELRTEPDRSGFSGVRPWLRRTFYDLV